MAHKYASKWVCALAEKNNIGAFQLHKYILQTIIGSRDKKKLIYEFGLNVDKWSSFVWAKHECLLVGIKIDFQTLRINGAIRAKFQFGTEMPL